MAHPKKPKNEKYKKVLITLPPTNNEDYKKVANSLYLSYSEFVNMALSHYTKLYIEQEREQNPEFLQEININKYN